MAPIVNGLISEYEGSVAIRTLNVDGPGDASDLANEYGVQFVPSFVFVDGNGEYVDMIIGEASEQALRSALDDLK